MTNETELVDDQSPDDPDQDDDSGVSHEMEFDIQFNEDHTEVIGVSRHVDGQLVPMHPNKHVSFDVVGDQVTETFSKPFGDEVITYEDTDQDGYYERVSEQWIGSSSPPTDNPMPALAHVLRFVHTDGDDFMALSDGDSTEGGQGADNFVFRDVGHVAIKDFHHAEGDKLVFDTGLGLLGKEQLISLVTAVVQDGDNLIIEFGQYASVTLIGIHPGDIGLDDVVVLS